ncbi:MAG: hypothetical protein DHS20C14_05840 [Phycisphaeraceae bacterium]|nr:MAG: hypothetical protein DHS20C14_05840 [Phycisphaeraceae bacterium]
MTDLRRHLPNMLTGSRFVLAGIFVAVVSTTRPAGASGGMDHVSALLDGSTAALLVAALIFALAALTDALDGQLSRLWHVESRLGRIMDPLADKVLVLGGFVLLAGPTFTVFRGGGGGTYQLSGVDAWMVILMITREMLVTSIRGMYEGEGFDFSAAGMGKLKMIAQSVAIPAILAVVALVPAREGSLARPWVLGLAWGVTAITVASAWPYVWKAYLASTGRIKAGPPKTPRPEPKLGKSSDRVEIPATHVRTRSRRRPSAGSGQSQAPGTDPTPKRPKPSSRTRPK